MLLPTDGLAEILRESAQWSNAQFPESYTLSRATHLLREAKELHEICHDDLSQEVREKIGSEIADVLILAVHLADNLDIDVTQEVRKKLEINRQRKWGRPDSQGVIEHTRE